MLGATAMPEDPHITFDGKTYRSIDDMPPNVRRSYEDVAEMMADRDGDGVPDMLEGGDPVFIENMRRAHAELTRRGEARPDPYTPVADEAARQREARRAEAVRRTPWMTYALMVIGLIVLILWWLGKLPLPDQPSPPAN
jgi:hypothetical protein